MFGGDFGLPPGPRYGRRSTGGAPPVAYMCCRAQMRAEYGISSGARTVLSTYSMSGSPFEPGSMLVSQCAREVAV